MKMDVSSTKAMLMKSIYTDSTLAALEGCVLIESQLHAKSFGGHATGQLRGGNA